MANFNPQVQPTQDPEWLRLSKPVEQPEANRSTAIGIKTAGDAAEEGLKAADTLEKDYHEKAGEAYGTKESENFLVGLSKDSLIANPDPEGLPPETGPTLNSVANNLASYKQGNIPYLEYKKNLYLKAKDYRSANPGYADYFDKGVAKVTGVTPSANEFISALVTQMNKNQENQKAILEKPRNAAYSAMEQGAPVADYIEAYDRRLIDGHTLNVKVQQAMAFKYQDATYSARLKQFEGDNKIADQQAKDRIIDHVSGLTNQVLDGTLVNFGMTTEKLKDAVARQARGEDTGIGDDQWIKGAQYLENQILQMDVAVDNKFNNEKDAMGRSTRVSAGTNYDSYKSAGKTQATQLLQAFKDKDVGLIYNNKNAGEAVASNSLWKIFQDKDNGPKFMLIGGARKAGGETWIPKMFDALLGSEGGASLTSPESVKTMLRNQSVGGGFQGIGGINQAFDAATQYGKPIDRQLLTMGPAYALTDKDTSDTAKLNTIKYTFSPKEDDLLGKIDMDGKTLDGRDIKGRYAVFAEYAKPSVVKEVARLSNQYGDKYFTDYRNWMETSFTKHLFGSDLNTIREMQSFPGMKLKFTDEGDAPPKFKIMYETISPQFAKEQKGRLAVLDQTLERVNGGVASLSNVYKESGDNLRARLTTIMSASSRIDFGNKGDADILNKMLNSVIASKKPKKEAE